MNPTDFKKVLATAAGIAEKAAVGGFVPIHRLLREFGAEIEFRPLLVEAMIAAPKVSTGRWLVLVDGETFPCPREVFDAETVVKPLSHRLRNTVAHELAHTLGHHPHDFGLETSLSRDELVTELERETERLSPALLVPVSSLVVAAQSGELDTIERIASLRDRLAVSSDVFVGRLNLLPQQEGHTLRFHRSLSDGAIGVGEWQKSTTPVISAWPLFANFSGLAPEFVLRLRERQHVSVPELFSAPDFFLNGGDSMTARKTIPFGTQTHPSSETSEAIIAVERTERKAGSKFLWMLRKA